jgi:hypothetical protein
VLIDVNLVLMLDPNPFTTAMMASEMPAAINPYSIAVAPDSSAINPADTFHGFDAPLRKLNVN